MIIPQEKASDLLVQLITDADAKFLIQNVTEASLGNWCYQLNLILTKIYGEDSPEASLVGAHGKSMNILAATMNGNAPNHIIYAELGGEQIRNQVEALRHLKENVDSGHVREVPAATTSPHIDIGRICTRFHHIAKQLRERHDDRDTLVVRDEYDTQDVFHSLLHLYFHDIRPEEWSPSYAGSGSRVDFLLKQEGIIIEIKKTRKSLRAKQIGEQLIIDIAKYQVHPDCKSLICFVYDPEEWIVNPAGLENDLTGIKDGLNVKVYIVPHGQ